MQEAIDVVKLFSVLPDSVETSGGNYKFSNSCIASYLFPMAQNYFFNSGLSRNARAIVKNVLVYVLCSILL